MGKMGPIGEALEMLQEETEKGLKTAVQQITGKAQNQQAGGIQVKQPFGNAQGKQAPTAQKAAVVAQTQQAPSDQAKPREDVPPDLKQVETQAKEEKKTFLKGLYGATPEITQAEVEKKKLEDKQKEEALRQQLHSQYYQSLTKSSRDEEERPQEKIEREEEEKKMAELQEEEEKKKELPVVVTKDMGSKEKLRGVSG